MRYIEVSNENIIVEGFGVVVVIVEAEKKVENGGEVVSCCGDATRRSRAARFNATSGHEFD